MDLSEAETRRLIDKQLRDAGWEADSVEIRWSRGTRPVKGRNLAIAEWPTETGPADYVLFVDGDTRPLTVVWSGPAKAGVLVRFAGVDSREAAEPLRDRYLEVPAGEPLSADTWYWHQIQGLEVTTTAGDSLGEVADVFRAGGGEVYVVRGGPLGEVLVPAVRSVVVELDPSEGRMVVDPVALDLPDKPPRRRRRQEITRRSRKAPRGACPGRPGRSSNRYDA